MISLPDDSRSLLANGDDSRKQTYTFDSSFHIKDLSGELLVKKVVALKVVNLNVFYVHVHVIYKSKTQVFFCEYHQNTDSEIYDRISELCNKAVFHPQKILVKYDSKFLDAVLPRSPMIAITTEMADYAFKKVFASIRAWMDLVNTALITIK